ncbi:hypothetical protein C8J57DRAFT_1326621 [Mycena rebaudengoi]|nr:hypothetical protein C8J57DRAFT_1326621 [Mycena rebaudengoi]
MRAVWRLPWQVPLCMAPGFCHPRTSRWIMVEQLGRWKIPGSEDWGCRMGQHIHKETRPIHPLGAGCHGRASAHLDSIEQPGPPTTPQRCCCS